MEPTPTITRPTVFAISGFAGAGKDTLADAIEHYIPASSSRVKMADELKEAINQALAYMGLPAVAFTEDREAKEQIRPLMVEFGRYCRGRDKSIFAKIAGKTVKHYYNTGALAVLVTDMRYPNEYDVLFELCNSELWTFVPIYVSQPSLGPANREEMDSIKELTNGDRHMWRFEFAKGDFGAIDEAAKKIVINALK